MIKEALDCNYKEDEVVLNLKFDKNLPNHYEQIKKMIKMLSLCRDDLAKYLQENEQ